MHNARYSGTDGYLEIKGITITVEGYRGATSEPYDLLNHSDCDVIFVPREISTEAIATAQALKISSSQTYHPSLGREPFGGLK